MLLASMMSSPRARVRAALFGAWLGLLVSPASASEAVLAPPPEPAEPVLTLDHMTYVSSRGERNETVLDAERAEILPLQDLAHLETVRARLSAEGSGGLDMTCDRGTFEIKTGDFRAEGNVRGRTGDGRRFRTTRLRYDSATGVVATDEPVWIEDETGKYRGGGFRYHVRENRFRLMGGATVVQE